ncbi:TRI41 ligase, partial [Columbina picui]|nr:TRI41 ligase [Columbina picui]
QRNFRPNLQLANMVQIIRQLHPHPQRSGAPVGGNRGPPELCERHQEPLKLFCEVDEEAICVVCRESRGHKQHSVVPLEEVLQEYRNKLQRHLEPLKQKLDAVLKQKSHEEAKITELKEQMRQELQELQSELEALQRFLLGEQVQQLAQLESRFQALLARQGRNVAALDTQRTALERLIAQAQDSARQDGLQLLKDSKGLGFRTPGLWGSGLEGIGTQDPSALGLRTEPPSVLRPFVVMTLRPCCSQPFNPIVPTAEVTLDPESAHPRLALSLDRRSVKLAERRPAAPATKRPEGGDFCVLGLPGFTTGRHYWEVEIAGRRGWAVGAASRRRHNQRPDNREVWCVGSTGKRYQACGGAEQTVLAPGERPRRFGVYLDYERGQLGFYNADTMGHIHTFRAAFRDSVFPFFRVLGRGTRIRICT